LSYGSNTNEEGRMQNEELCRTRGAVTEFLPSAF